MSLKILNEGFSKYFKSLNEEKTESKAKKNKKKINESYEKWEVIDSCDTGTVAIMQNEDGWWVGINHPEEEFGEYEVEGYDTREEAVQAAKEAARLIDVYTEAGKLDFTFDSWRHPDVYREIAERVRKKFPYIHNESLGEACSKEKCKKEDKKCEEKCDDKLDEAIPPDLAKAYKRADNWYYKYADRDDTNKVDYEASEYKVITPEEAIEAKKRGDIESINLMFGNDVVSYTGSADARSPDNYVNLPWNKAYVNKNGRRITDTRKIPFSYLVTIADKIYLADLKKVDPEKMKQRLANPYKSYYDNRRVANTLLGHMRYDDSNDWDHRWKASSEKYAREYTRKLNDLEAKWADGDISRNEYEKLKAQYQDGLDREQSEIDKYQRNIDKRNWERKDRRRSALDYIGNKEMMAPIDKYNRLKSDLYYAKRDVDSAQTKLDNLKASGSMSPEFSYEREQVAKLTQQIASLQASLNRYQSKLDAADDPAAIEAAQSQLDSDTARFNNVRAELDKLLHRTGTNESLKESKDLSKVEGSMAKTLSDNIEKVYKGKTAAEVASIVEDILKGKKIDTPASKRLLMNIRKSNSGVSAISTVLNSILAGSNNKVNQK